MPALPPAAVLNALLNAFEQSGAQATLMSNVRQNPRRFRVSTSEGGYDLWAYTWTITHGGGPRNPNEYRIQMTSVSSPLPLNPTGPTLLIGIDATHGVFGGFDLFRHKTFTGDSPSVQIPRSTLVEALTAGFSFALKANDEIAVAFRPDQFLHYAFNAARLHAEGFAVQPMLDRAVAQQPISSAAIAALPPERKKVVQMVERLVRDARFRGTVVNAYQHRCAVTRIQLDLLDAAHILPVGADGSTDLVTNGLALGPTYHRAFDRGLIYLGEDYVMRINPGRRDELQRQSRHGGLADFQASLDRQIHLPPNAASRPDPHMIRMANRFRRIPGV